MAMRALAAVVAGRRVAGQSVFPAPASIRSGGARSNDSRRRRGAHTRAEKRDAAAAAQNSKNVEEVVHNADAAWVPDLGTGVSSSTGNGARADAHAAASVLDQTVFNREEEMEDVERPTFDAGAE